MLLSKTFKSVENDKLDIVVRLLHRQLDESSRRRLDGGRVLREGCEGDGGLVLDCVRRGREAACEER